MDNNTNRCPHGFKPTQDCKDCESALSTQYYLDFLKRSQSAPQPTNDLGTFKAIN